MPPDRDCVSGLGPAAVTLPSPDFGSGDGAGFLPFIPTRAELG